MMIESTARELAELTGAELICEGAPIAGDIAIDSREVEKGSIFVAFVGEVADGNAFAPAAIEAGASLVVLSKEPSASLVAAANASGCSVLRAKDDDCEGFLLALAHARIEAHPEWLVLAITGSVGKTTTKDLVAAGMASRYRVHATRGNYNSVIGLPLTVLAAPDDTEALVLEMGMNHAGEIERMSRCAMPSIAIITNIGTSHIGLLGSREGIARAKGEIVAGMRAHKGAGPLLVLDAAGDFKDFIVSKLAEPAHVEVAYAGEGAESAVDIEGLLFDSEGRASFELVYADGDSHAVSLMVPGMSVATDLALAAAAVDAAGVPRKAALKAMSSYKSANMRMNVAKNAAGVTVIDDSYNAAPASMAAALDALAARSCQNRRIAVLGEMGEMGDHAPLYHALTGAYAAAKDIDVLVCVGEELAAAMADAACTMGFSDDRIVRVRDCDELIRIVAPVLEEGDLVLVKASRAAGLDRFAKEVREACS